MDDQLLTLRGISYEVGRKHDQALIDCGDTLMRGDLVDAERAVSNHNAVAKQYGDALARLSNHLSELEQTSDIVDEARRTERLLYLLDREVDTVAHRLEILKTQ